MSRVTTIVIVALALSGVSCNLTGPSQSLTGIWTASLGKSSFVVMTLHQDGDDVSGTACARSDGFLLYHGVPVRGDHPRVEFDVSSSQTQPCCGFLAGTHFSGRQDDTGDIVGRIGNVDVRFELSASDVCR
jgi:hypothetical protein